MIKATSILHKAQALNAKPAELLEIAIHNLKAGEKQLVPTREEERPTGRDSMKTLSFMKVKALTWTCFVAKKFV